MTLQLQPITLKDARRFIDRHHRHHRPPTGGLFAIACNDGAEVVGVAIIGRPTPRAYQDGWTCEVTRLATDSTPHVASKLYAASWRAARSMGYRRIGTYTLETEPGTSVKAAKWKALYQTRGEEWDRPSRPRSVTAPTGPKTFWSPEECADLFEPTSL